MDLIIHVDGGARGNPGPAGAGVTMRDTEGTPVYEAGFFLGRQTNNFAEYTALIRALERVQNLDTSSIVVHSDSELLVKQITGEYRVKNPTLAELYEQVQMLLIRVPKWTIRHVRREANKRADELANLAMDRKRDLVVFDLHDPDAITDADALDAEPTLDSESEDDGSATGPRIVRAEANALPNAAPDEDEDDAGFAERGEPAVQITVATPPNGDFCPAADSLKSTFTIGSRLPAGLCVHAAHAILPTLLAMLNTQPREFDAVPTLTVRCAQPGCDAVFRLSPVRGANGS